MPRYTFQPTLPNVSSELAVYPPLLGRLLHMRGISTREAAEQFLQPDYDRDNHHPYRMKDMEKAVLRVVSAIEKKERIVIYSDYDADGIPGAVVLHDVFKKIGFDNFFNYIPHRTEEGFGLNIDAVKEFIGSGVSLIITIDCGIADVLPVAHAQENGIDVIITDHHEEGLTVPAAYAVVNPKQKNCEYPEKVLCGSGVLYKFVQALLYTLRQREMISGIPNGWEKWLLDMVGIATLSDMVPLTGENRMLAHYGLKVLRMSPRVGLQRLLKTIDIQQRYITEDDIGFMISPRINAASRMGIPLDAFKLLATKDEVEAAGLCTHLHTINDERKGIVAAMVKDIKKKLHARKLEGLLPEGVIVVGNPDWKPSLCGLAANSVKDEFGGAVFVWGREGGSTIKGSCRSDGTVSVVELMQQVPETFIGFGGHTMSGGFSCDSDQIHSLQEMLSKAYAAIKEKGLKDVAHVVIDARLTVADINWKTYEQVEKLAPFGVGNPKPLFLFENVLVGTAKMFGKEKNHLELVFAHPSAMPVKAIAFFAQPEFVKNFPEGQHINLVASLEKSLFRGRKELRLRIVDVIR